MTTTKRNALKLIMKRYTEAKNVSKAVAMRSLVTEGIYTKDGNITVQYGGEKKFASGEK